MVYAWAEACSVSEIPGLLSRFGGKVGAVLYPRQFEAARGPGRFVAFLGGPADAEALLSAVQGGARFDGALVWDEKNLVATWTEYAAVVERVRPSLLKVGVAFWGMSTRSLRGERGGADVLWLQKQSDRLGAERWGWNATGARGDVMREVAAHPEKRWLLSPHPWRFTVLPLFDAGWLNWLRDHFVGGSVRWYAEVMAQRADVAFWCLKSYEPGHFGLFTVDGKRLTSLGRQLRRSLGVA